MVERAKTAMADPLDADSMGVKPTSVRELRMRTQRDLVESSAAVMSQTQPGVFFTINDSGNAAILFAVDTTGAARGRWRVQGASNIDWEAATLTRCNATSAEVVPNSAHCLVVGDVGDNAAARSTVTLYQISEPEATAGSVDGEVQAQPLVFRYPDEKPHDVESIYAGPDGTVYLITKRALKDAAGKLRPSLVFAIAASSWLKRDTVVAEFVDSLPIVPGSSPDRRLTDASLSPDAKLLAVRTYGQVYVLATDSTSGRVLHSVPPAVCNVEGLHEETGEGITWIGSGPQLLLTREGRGAPALIVTCPLPQR